MLTVESAWKVVLAGDSCHGTSSIGVFIISLSASSAAAPRSRFVFNARYWEPVWGGLSLARGDALAEERGVQAWRSCCDQALAPAAQPCDAGRALPAPHHVLAAPALIYVGDLPSILAQTGSCGKAEAEGGEGSRGAIRAARVREGAEVLHRSPPGFAVPGTWSVCCFPATNGNSTLHSAK